MAENLLEVIGFTAVFVHTANYCSVINCWFIQFVYTSRFVVTRQYLEEAQVLVQAVQGIVGTNSYSVHSLVMQTVIALVNVESSASYTV